MPALLVAIATLGVIRSVTLEQSSWQGASFGMFATYENTTSRAVRVRLDRADGPVFVNVPADLDDDAVRLEVVPTDASARRLAAAVLRRPAADGAHRVVVEVWGLRFRQDGVRLRATSERIAGGQAVR